VIQGTGKMKMRLFNKKDKGFSLIELVVGVFILIVIILVLWEIYSTSVNYIIMAKELRIASDDLQDVMERIQSVNFSGITTSFPDGATVGQDMVGGFDLDNESIVVRYPQGTGVDPLQIEVEIDWTDKKGRPHSKIFRTVRTGNV
jgi:type II secretory pathway pseudopilin PulG